jgi:Zn-dependent protease
MLALLRLPLELLWVASRILIAVFDGMRGHKRRSFESSTLIKAPRDAVWRFLTAPRAVFDGPPVIELVSEPVPGEDGLHLCRVFVRGQEFRRSVERVLRLDESEGILRAEIVPHALSVPPAEGTDYYFSAHLKELPNGTVLSLRAEVTFGSFRQRIVCPMGVRQQMARIKQQCEKEAGSQNRLAGLANHWLVLSLCALGSFWYLFGWQEALLVSLIVLLHELGHAAAMRLVGITVQGIYFIPFFGGAAIPKTAYRRQGQLGFVALMGPGFSLVPTLALVGIYYATGETWLLHAAFMFALINGLNLLPVYPLDGGLILNSLLSSLNRQLAHAARWAGILTGLGGALYFRSLLLGFPFLLFALQLYVSGGRSSDLKRLSPFGGMALVVTFAATFVLYLVTFSVTVNLKAVLEGQSEIGSLEARLGIPVRCDLPATSGGVLERFLSERGRLDGRSLLRTLAWADRAGHGDIVQYRLAGPHGFALPSDLMNATAQRVGRWLALAKSGTLSAIEEEIAGLQTSNDDADLRGLLSGALVVHGRYRDALGLLPSNRWSRLSWLRTTLLDMVSTGAIAEAASLLERTKADTVAMGMSVHLRNVARSLQRLPAALGDKTPLVAALVDQLRTLSQLQPARVLPACLPGAANVCTDDENRRLAGELRTPEVRAREIELLAGFGEVELDLPDEFRSDPRRWWHVLAVFAAASAEEGKISKSDALRNQVAQALALAENQALRPAQQSEQVYLRPAALGDLFEVAYATTRASRRLARSDIEGAEAIAEATIQRLTLDTSIITLMVDHYLAKGEWSRAEAWHKRHPRPETVSGGDEGEDGEFEPQALLDLDYQLNIATAAAKLGEMARAGAALQRAQSISCELANSSAYLHQEWSSFLRRAYLLGAFQEGRLPAHALDGP